MTKVLDSKTDAPKDLPLYHEENQILSTMELEETSPLPLTQVAIKFLNVNLKQKTDFSAMADEICHFYHLNTKEKDLNSGFPLELLKVVQRFSKELGLNNLSELNLKEPQEQTKAHDIFLSHLKEKMERIREMYC